MFPSAGLKRLTRAVVACVAATALSGCRVDAQVQVRADEHGAGLVALTVTADDEVAKQAPGILADLRFDDARTAGWSVRGPSATADGGLTVELTKAFSNPVQASAILAELSSSTGPLRGVKLEQTKRFAHTETMLSGIVGIEGAMAAFSDEAVTTLLGGSLPLAGRLPEPLADHLTITIVTDLAGVGDEDQRISVPVGRASPFTITATLDDPAARRARTISRVLVGVAAVGIVTSLAMAIRLLIGRSPDVSG